MHTERKEGWLGGLQVRARALQMAVCTVLSDVEDSQMRGSGSGALTATCVRWVRGRTSEAGGSRGRVRGNLMLGAVPLAPIAPLLLHQLVVA